MLSLCDAGVLAAAQTSMGNNAQFLPAGLAETHTDAAAGASHAVAAAATVPPVPVGLSQSISRRCQAKGPGCTEAAAAVSGELGVIRTKQASTRSSTQHTAPAHLLFPLQA